MSTHQHDVDFEAPTRTDDCPKSGTITLTVHYFGDANHGLIPPPLILKRCILRAGRRIELQGLDKRRFYHTLAIYLHVVSCFDSPEAVDAMLFWVDRHFDDGVSLISLITSYTYYINDK